MPTFWHKASEFSCVFLPSGIFDPKSRAQMSQSLSDAVPMVVQAITSSIQPTVPASQIQSALRCLQAWMTIFPTRYMPSS